MIAIDTNILVYAHRKESSFHQQAKQVLTDLAEGNQSWAIPWPCLHEFIGVVTHARIYIPPTPIEETLLQIEYWLTSPHLQVIGEESGYWLILRNIVREAKITGSKIHDAKIAAICGQNNVKVLYSTDRDFSRMKGLTVKNPLL